MGDFSPERAMAMERRHILEGEKRIARQETLVAGLTAHGRGDLLRLANEMLTCLRESLELSRERLRDLESRYAKPHDVRRG